MVEPCVFSEDGNDIHSRCMEFFLLQLMIAGIALECAALWGEEAEAELIKKVIGILEILEAALNLLFPLPVGRKELTQRRAPLASGQDASRSGAQPCRGLRKGISPRRNPGALHGTCPGLY